MIGYVKCLEDFSYPALTGGKVYEVYEITAEEVTVRDDAGMEREYPTQYFDVPSAWMHYTRITQAIEEIEDEICDLQRKIDGLERDMDELRKEKKKLEGEIKDKAIPSGLQLFPELVR